MTFFRSLSVALDRFSERMHGQRLEQRGTDYRGRIGADYATLTRAHSNHNISPLGLGR